MQRVSYTILATILAPVAAILAATGRVPAAAAPSPAQIQHPSMPCATEKAVEPADGATGSGCGTTFFGAIHAAAAAPAAAAAGAGTGAPDCSPCESPGGCGPYISGKSTVHSGPASIVQQPDGSWCTDGQVEFYQPGTFIIIGCDRCPEEHE